MKQWTKLKGCISWMWFGNFLAELQNRKDLHLDHCFEDLLLTSILSQTVSGMEVGWEKILLHPVCTPCALSWRWGVGETCQENEWQHLGIERQKPTPGHLGGALIQHMHLPGRVNKHIRNRLMPCLSLVFFTPSKTQVLSYVHKQALEKFALLPNPECWLFFFL